MSVTEATLFTLTLMFHDGDTAIYRNLTARAVEAQLKLVSMVNSLTDEPTCPCAVVEMQESITTHHPATDCAVCGVH